MSRREAVMDALLDVVLEREAVNDLTSDEALGALADAAIRAARCTNEWIELGGIY